MLKNIRRFKCNYDLRYNRMFYILVSIFVVLLLSKFLCTIGFTSCLPHCILKPLFKKFLIVNTWIFNAHRNIFLLNYFFFLLLLKKQMSLTLFPCLKYILPPIQNDNNTSRIVQILFWDFGSKNLLFLMKIKFSRITNRYHMIIKRK